jgi:prepilin-type N-terminal cleavage/methylation domain-containing protein
MQQRYEFRRELSQVSGFTLIEIMIVVGILALLLAIAIPNWIKTRERAQRDICIENLQQIETAKQLWALETGKATGDEPDEADLIGATLYLKIMPACPAGGGPYEINPVGTPPECTIEDHFLE